jgi:hypothetical protein
MDYNGISIKNPNYVGFEDIKEWRNQEQIKELGFSMEASTDPDTIYFHEEMRKPDTQEFIKVMKKEVESHAKNEV